MRVTDRIDASITTPPPTNPTNILVGSAAAGGHDLHAPVLVLVARTSSAVSALFLSSYLSPALPIPAFLPPAHRRLLQTNDVVAGIGEGPCARLSGGADGPCYLGLSTRAGARPRRGRRPRPCGGVSPILIKTKTASSTYGSPHRAACSWAR